MHRSRLAAAAVAVACGVSVLGVATAVGATSPRGKLTTLEYKQLSSMYSGLLNPTSAANWTSLTAACERAGTATALLATQRSSCVAEINALSYIQTVSNVQKKCTSGVAARSGAASSRAASSTVQDLAVLRDIVCLNSDYQQLGHLAAESYTQTVAARQSALARGFTGVCLSTLVDTVPQMQVQYRFALTAQRLAQDSGTLTRQAGNRVTPSHAGIAQFESDSKAFGEAFLALTKLNGPTKLSVCPHQ